MVHQQSTVIETDTIRKEQPWMREENLPQRKLKERASKDSPVWAKCIEMLVNQTLWTLVDCGLSNSTSKGPSSPKPSLPWPWQVITCG
jgi:hypothetical protein